MQSNMTRRDAETLVAYIRSRILELFPGREETYELIYGTRFKRLLDEFATMSEHPRRGVVIPFPSPGR